MKTLPPIKTLGQALERPLVLICIGLVRGYQLTLSPLLPPACRFYPSCSQYALDALYQRRLFVALGLIAWRLLRCNPFCVGGYDPVKGGEEHCCGKREEETGPLNPD